MPKKNVYTIPAELPFIETLATGLINQASENNSDLADFLILLPTRRAVRALCDSFLEISKGKPLILPRILPLGDLDEEEILITGWEETSLQIEGERSHEIPDPISNLLRQLMLASRITALDKDNMGIDQATLLAAELGNFLDQVQREQLDFSAIRKLVPEEYAEHWQITLKFLEIITQFWPGILKDKNLIDPAERRNLVMKEQLSSWERNLPRGPVIAAGSTGSIPATADLLNFISELSMGAVILPGLDHSLDIESVENIETHPQYGLYALLKKFDLNVNDVEFWPNDQIRAQIKSGYPIHLAFRKELVCYVMRPPKRISRSRSSNPSPLGCVSGFTSYTVPFTMKVLEGGLTQSVPQLHAKYGGNRGHVTLTGSPNDGMGST